MTTIRSGGFRPRPPATLRRIRVAAALAAVALLSACTVGGVATIAPYRSRPIEQVTVRTVIGAPAGTLALSADGALLAVADKVHGICLLATSPQPGAAPRCADVVLTGTRSLFAAFSPNGRWVALGYNVEAQGGGPVWVVDTRTGKALRVPSVDGHSRAPSYIAMTWETWGDLLLIGNFFNSDGAQTRLVDVDPDSLVPRVVAEATGPFEFQSGYLVSGGSSVLFTVFRGDQLEPDLVVVDLSTGRRKEFGPLGPGGTQLIPLGVSPDGRVAVVGLATLGHAGPPRLLDIGSGKLTELPRCDRRFRPGDLLARRRPARERVHERQHRGAVGDGVGPVPDAGRPDSLHQLDRDQHRRRAGPAELVQVRRTGHLRGSVRTRRFSGGLATGWTVGQCPNYVTRGLDQPTGRSFGRIIGGPAGAELAEPRGLMTMASEPSRATGMLREARDFLVACRTDYDRAVKGFRWPGPDTFNFGLEWFDVLAAEHPGRAALTIVEEDGGSRTVSYAELSARSDQVARWLRGVGVRRGHRIILMLGNQMELWEIILAAIKVGAVLIPASTLLTPEDLRDRVVRGRAAYVVARDVDTTKFAEVPGEYGRIVVGAPRDGWRAYDESSSGAVDFTSDGPTSATDPMLLYFTSGTTALPKLVEHSQVSYPIGHLSTMYWLGLQPGDVHLNISSPGWAKHAWSNVFAPWIAGATVFVHNYQRFSAVNLMRVMAQHGVTTFCAPPTVWRMLIQADLSVLATPPREVVGAGEPLNPEVIEQVRRAWGVTIRDGFGQTEMTLAIGNSPGQRVKDGSMGRPMPGFAVALVDVTTGVVTPVDTSSGQGPASGGDGPVGEGEICLDLTDRPLALMAGYHGDEELTARAMAENYYHTGDVGSVDDQGYLTYVGRSDDVFKASDYRISPFELESVLLEHESVAEAAVVPAPDELRLAVPKAYVVLAAGYPPDRHTAGLIFGHSQRHLAPYKRIRRLEFAELPKTISGKIRRVELRGREEASAAAGDGRSDAEYRLEDFPELSV